MVNGEHVAASGLRGIERRGLLPWLTSCARKVDFQPVIAPREAVQANCRHNNESREFLSTMHERRLLLEIGTSTRPLTHTRAIESCTNLVSPPFAAIICVDCASSPRILIVSANVTRRLPCSSRQGFYLRRMLFQRAGLGPRQRLRPRTLHRHRLSLPSRFR